MIRYGQHSDEVAHLQNLLNLFGYGLAVDGAFGDATLAAVKGFQGKHGLAVDGDAGPNTLGKINALLNGQQAPAKPAITGVNTTDTQATISWNAVGNVTEYRCEVVKAETGFPLAYTPVQTASTSCTVTLGEGSYYAYVMALNSGERSEASEWYLFGIFPHVHNYTEEGYDTEHPHKVYRKCSCGEVQYTGETKKVPGSLESLDGCEQCNPHQHSYILYYDEAHPHREYQKCSCRDISYTGNTKKQATCSQCYPPRQTRAVKLQIGIPQMTVDGVWQEIDPGRGTAPIVENDRTLLPVRAVVEAFGAYVLWDETNEQITIYKDDLTMYLWVNSRTSVVNGESHVMDVAPVVLGERTFMPLRFIAESMGLTVGWNEANQTRRSPLKGKYKRNFLRERRKGRITVKQADKKIWRRILCITLAALLCIAASGCANGVGNYGKAAYDSKILYVVDDGEVYYLFFQDGTAAAMDVIEYYERQEYADSDWKSETNNYYLGTAIGSNKEIYLRCNRESNCLAFYQTLLGRSMPFNVAERTGLENRYMGQAYDSVLQSLKASPSIVSVQELEFSWPPADSRQGNLLPTGEAKATPTTQPTSAPTMQPTSTPISTSTVKTTSMLTPTPTPTHKYVTEPETGTTAVERDANLPLRLEDATNIGNRAEVCHGFTDNYGNYYDSALCTRYYVGGYKLEYLLNMKYSNFSGSICVRESDSKLTGLLIKFITDGDVIYTSPVLDKTSGPIPIDLDVSNCNDFKIQLEIAGAGWDNGSGIYLAGCSFHQ